MGYLPASQCFPALSATHAAHRLKPIHPPKRLWHAGSMRPGRKFHILVAEDDANDRFFVEKAFRAIHGPVTLTMVEDGEAVERYLLRREPFSDAALFPFPSLIMLDIKMPKRTGLEVLAWISKTDFRRIPVMMVSSSDLQSDVDRAFDLGANAYLVKPVSVQKMQSVFQVTADFWTTVSEWPSQPVCHR